MKQELFETRYAPEWAQFEAWLQQRAARDKKAEPPFDAAELPQRYRRLCHQLALARDRRYGTDLVARLHRLAIEVHQLLYGAGHEGSHAWLGYIFGGFARNVRAQGRYVLAAALLFFAPFVALVFVTQAYPDAVYYVVDPEQVAQFETMYGPAAEKLGRRGAESDFSAFGFYIFNNVRIAFQTFAGGLLFGFGSLFFLVFNGVVLGAVEGHVTAIGYGTAFYSFVAGHSALELGGIVLSGAAGLRLGFALLAPGRLTRKEALGLAGRDAAGIMYGVAGMIVAAAFVEAFWSSITTFAPGVKYAVGAAMVILVIAYFCSLGARVQLDRMALHLRRRGPWEAIDLGCAMARRWWKPLVTAWLAIYLPVAVVLYAIFNENPFIAVAVLWWLKPAFDRVLLEVLSRAVFGDVPAARDAVAALRHSRGILASLTIYRFDLARSFNLPIWHLEKLTGAAARKRAQSLQRRARSYAVWLTVICANLEIVTIVAFFGAIDLFTPPQIEASFGLKSYFSGDAPLARQYLDSVVQVLAVALVEPFYVASGFALYLNRRTELEAWDVELALRRFARRTAERAVGLAAAVLACVWIAAALPLPAYAAAAAQREPQAVVREILDSKDFNQHREVTRLRYLGSKDSPTDTQKPLPKTNALLQWIAEAARVLMWLGAVALVAALAYFAWRFVGKWAPEGSSRPPTPDVLFGLDIAPGSLPDDVAAAARAAVDAGDIRGALALLYRGALSALVNREGIDFAPGDTEADCVRRSAGHVSPDKSQFLGALVAAWQATAYGARAASPQAVRALCAEWKVHFAESASA